MTALTQPLCKAEILACLARLRASQLFCKAHRLSGLLQFLVEKCLEGSTRDTTEYGIGIDVFDRDPAVYSTGDDPIVRVQVGRLREKLKSYYAGAGSCDDVVIAIPPGSYMPVIRRAAASLGRLETRRLLAIRPLRSVGDAAAGTAFARGLSEELSYRLFREFGDKVVSYGFPQERGGRPTDVSSHLLEGSVRFDGDLVRTAVRLIDAASGAIVWSVQQDRRGNPGIPLQEDLAESICAALNQYFCHG